MNKTLVMLLTILLTAVIVGGGVYFWQQSQLESLQGVVEELQSENEALKGDVESTNDKVESEETQGEETSSLEGDYVNEKYGYSLDPPSNFDVNTKDYDNDSIEDESTIWVGTKSDFWTDGFYVRIVSDLDSRISEVQENVSEIVGQSQVTLGGKSATKVVVGWDIGYQVAYYFIEANNHIFEIQVVNSNDEAQDVIETIKFAE